LSCYDKATSRVEVTFMLPSNLLAKKVILVTGGGSGLGLAMSQHFAGLGAKIAICGRNQGKLDAVIDDIDQSTLAIQTDVRDEAAVEMMINRVVDKFGKIDVLVNNAAGNFYCPSEELSANGFRTIVDIVLNGTFLCSSRFGRWCIENEHPGTILNIVTTYADGGSAFVLPSACSKAGVQVLTQSLAVEWAEYDIRVNAIAPGPFPTAGAWKRLMPSSGFEKDYKARHPMRRFGEKHELGNLAAFLVSDLSPYINGEVICIDGGEHLLGSGFNFLTHEMPRKKLKTLFAKMRPKK